MIMCHIVFNVCLKATLFLPVWSRDAKSLDTPEWCQKSFSGTLALVLRLSCWIRCSELSKNFPCSVPDCGYNNLSLPGDVMSTDKTNELDSCTSPLLSLFHCQRHPYTLQYITITHVHTLSKSLSPYSLIMDVVTQSVTSEITLPRFRSCLHY